MPADAKMEIWLTAKDMTAKTFGVFQSRVGAITRSVTSLKGALAALGVGYGLTELARAGISVASSFEQMQIKLDALTNGRGRQTLEDLNAWAVKMPVNTQEAVDTFVMMQALGLDPTIDKMQTLVDVSAIFGDDAMPRVARALGQMQTLGKLSAEELNQLSEAGINARKYLTEAFGMSVEELKKSEVSINRIIDAIWKGLNADYSGAAQASMKSWRGLVTTFKSNMTEITRQVMDAGVYDAFKDVLDNINQGMSSWIAANDKLLAQKVREYIKGITDAVSSLVTVIEKVSNPGESIRSDWEDFWDWTERRIRKLRNPLKTLTEDIKNFGQITQGVDIYAPGDVPASDIAALSAAARNNTTGSGATASGGQYNPWSMFLPDVPPSIEKLTPIDETYVQTLEDFQQMYRESVDWIIKKSNDLVTTIKGVDDALTEYFDSVLNAAVDASLDEVYAEYDASADALKEKNQKLADDMSNAFTGWANNFSSTLNDMVWNAEASFSDILKSFGQMITQMLIQKSLIEPLVSSGSQFFADLFHGGGTVGVDSTSGRSVPASTFIGAPRLHGGLISGEFPAILQRGESVLTPGQLAAVAGSKSQTIININDYSGGAEVQRQQTQAGETIDITIGRMVAGQTLQYGTPMNKAMRQMGGRKQLTVR